ncbi:MAG TPA: tRNA (adenosine(37)-N6)-threonylcarbamoyltransferase complex ATPase subunit type 1 TsaE [Thermomicrobiales bacterium]|nr:tRNA (adenosine(37)-N6)-threonylcarbamoyltransferase complex ATPase subunit type 1 TsaE [Thermomicrobiales bacterium]
MARAKAGARPLPALDFISHSPEQTVRVGRRLGQHALGGDVFFLSGTFGAGKTVLTRGLAHGLGVAGGVTSPSFTLINEYDGRDAAGRPVTLYHVDLYRLDGDDAVASLGLDDYLGAPDAICVIEWPEHLPDAAGVDRLAVALGVVSETKRRLTFTPRGGRYLDLVGAIKAEAFGVEP